MSIQSEFLAETRFVAASGAAELSREVYRRMLLSALSSRRRRAAQATVERRSPAGSPRMVKPTVRLQPLTIDSRMSESTLLCEYFDELSRRLQLSECVSADHPTPAA